jgi:hypothetical protein
MNLTEMLRLQGMRPTNFTQVVSDAQLGRQLGNSMSVNVLERLFARLLPAAGLVPADSLVDMWESNQDAAIATLQGDRWIRPLMIRPRPRLALPKRRRLAGPADAVATFDHGSIAVRAWHYWSTVESMSDFLK